MPESIFEIRDGLHLPTDLARGPWSREALHGGAPAALLAEAMQGLGAAGRVVRITVEFLRPVPVAPLRLEARLARAGRQVQRTEASLFHDEREIVRAEAIHLRRRDAQPLPDPRSTSRDGECAPPGPEEAVPIDPPPGAEAPAFHDPGVEVRLARGRMNDTGPAFGWFRLAWPVLPGTTPSALARTVAACDFGNGIAACVPWTTHTFPNADLVVSLHREPVGEWIGLDAVTRAGADGTGVAECVVYDVAGPVGTSVQSLLFEPRATALPTP